MNLIFTCEHGGNKIPAKFAKLFKTHAKLLKTHRGLDIGALAIAKFLTSRLNAPLIAAQTSRLLVDLNRSNGNSGQFSKVTQSLSPKEKAFILKKYYFPHNVRVQNLVHKNISSGVIHIGVHSFTPKLNGEVRNADIGILFDPARKAEARFAALLKRELSLGAPDLKVRMNYPYKGTSDGLTKILRQAFGTNYVGIELEMNQKIFKKPHKNLGHQLAIAISQAKEQMP